MTGERFTLDTNVLVYALDSKAGARHRTASHIISRAVLLDCVLTLQAVSEFFSVATRKTIVPRRDAAAQAIDWMEMFQVVPASASAVRTALAEAVRRRTSYWDALLIATAAEAGCSAVLTEDLSDGATLFGVRVVHPFAGEVLSDNAQRLLEGD
jgi:predicted nucleic acid-binding protein